VKFLEYFDFSEQYLSKKIKELSAGYRQKLNLIQALSRESRLVILDEPTSNLDFTSIEKLKKLILELNSQNRAFLVVSHNFNLVRDVANRCILIKDGEKVYEGKVDEVLRYAKRI